MVPARPMCMGERGLAGASSSSYLGVAVSTGLPPSPLIQAWEGFPA